MRPTTDAARRAKAVLISEIAGIAGYACGPAFSQLNAGNLRDISLALLKASHRIELEIKRRLDAHDCKAKSRQP